jgi:hypothetical protein
MLKKIEHSDQGKGGHNETNPRRFPGEKPSEKHGGADDMEAEQKFKKNGAKN